jgi:cysteine desulfurase/selenocysteine lyase
MEITTERTEKKTFSLEEIRKDFPILQTKVYGKDLIYLDNAATTHKPVQVVERINKYYYAENSNIHRGVHHLSQLATNEYEAAREKIRAFINAKSAKEIIFTRGATESINLVASSFGRKYIGAGDEIIISAMEHHANIVPWQIFCETTGAVLKAIPIDDNGELILDAYQDLLTERTRLVSVVHISNSLGTVNPVEEIIRLAHERNIPVLLDGAQSIQHAHIDVQALDVDFFAFSGHKLYGPTGIGVLYGKQALLELMPPYQGGGDMIRSVTLEKTTYNDLPYKFEAGTPNIEGVIALGAAIDYVNAIGLDAIAAHENELNAYALEKLLAIPKLKLIGNAKKRAPVFSFVLEGIHPHDIGTIFDFEGVAIRAGHHCTQPVMQRFGIPATARASFALYTTREEIDRLIAAIHKVFEVFS